MPLEFIPEYKRDALLTSLRNKASTSPDAVAIDREAGPLTVQQVYEFATEGRVPGNDNSARFAMQNLLTVTANHLVRV